MPRKKQSSSDKYLSNKKTNVRQVSLSIRWIVIGILISGCANNFAGDDQSNKAVKKKQKPLIVTTIRPLTLIAQAVAGNDLEIKQLLPDGEIPHHYSLRISDRRLFEETNILIWIGENIEHFIVATLDNYTELQVVEAGEMEEIDWPDSESGERDYHLWLNPKNALAIAKALVTEIEKYEGVDRKGLQGRLMNFEKDLKKADREIKQKMESVKERKFIVDHDALGHFEYRYELEKSGYLRDSNGVEIGVKEMANLMGEKNISCLIGDNESRISKVKNISEKLKSRYVILDTLSVNKKIQENVKKQKFKTYTEYLQGISNDIYDCLKKDYVK